MKNKKNRICACDSYQEIINLFQDKMMTCAKLNGECKSEVIDDVANHWQKINEKLLNKEGERIREERGLNCVDFWGLN